MRVLLLKSLFTIALSASVAANLTVNQAYYRDTNNSLHIFVTNKGSESLEILPPVVNGKDLAQLGRDENRDRKIIWYRIRPRTLQPGEIGNILVTFGEPKEEPASVEIRTSSGETIKREIPCVPEEFRLQAIRFSEDLQTIDIYARWNDPSKATSLRRVRLNGENVRGLATPWPARSFESIAYTRINLDQPLVKNSFHVIEVEAEGGFATAYQIRAIPSEFLIGIYGALNPVNIEDFAAHGCNHYISFRDIPMDMMDALHEKGLSGGPKYIPEHLVNRDEESVVIFDEENAREIVEQFIGHPALQYHHLVDEPDVADYYAGRWLGSTAMELAARVELLEKLDPDTYTFVQLDNTFRPRNYAAYGESTDILATHRYTLGNFLRSEAGEETFTRPPFLDDFIITMDAFRPTTEPRPYFWVTQFFNLGPRRSGRSQTIQEMRLQCYMGIATGSTGLIHYIHSGSTGGGEGAKTPELWDPMTDLHKELMPLGEMIKIGTPAPEGWVETDSNHILAYGILCGEEMAVVLINRNHRSALQTFVSRPVNNVTVSVKMPPWIRASALEVISETGSVIPAIEKSGALTFNVGEIVDARAFRLKMKGN